jgi:hypothetical protein
MRILAVYDNGGESFDRYTVYYDANIQRWTTVEGHPREILEGRGMSENPCHPQGFGQMIQGTLGEHNGKEISFSELPQACKDLVNSDLQVDDIMHRPHEEGG